MGNGINTCTLTFDKEVPPLNPFALENILGNNSIKGKINGTEVTISGACANQIEEIRTAANNIITYLFDEMGIECVDSNI